MACYKNTKDDRWDLYEGVPVPIRKEGILKRLIDAIKIFWR